MTILNVNHTVHVWLLEGGHERHRVKSVRDAQSQESACAADEAALSHFVDFIVHFIQGHAVCCIAFLQQVAATVRVVHSVVQGVSHLPFSTVQYLHVICIITSVLNYPLIQGWHHLLRIHHG